MKPDTHFVCPPRPFARSPGSKCIAAKCSPSSFSRQEENWAIVLSPLRLMTNCSADEAPATQTRARLIEIFPIQGEAANDAYTHMVGGLKRILSSSPPPPHSTLRLICSLSQGFNLSARRSRRPERETLEAFLAAAAHVCGYRDEY